MEIGASASHLIYYMSQQLEHMREGPRTQIVQASWSLPSQRHTVPLTFISLHNFLFFSNGTLAQFMQSWCKYDRSLPGPYVDWWYYFRVSGIIRKWGPIGGSRLPGACLWRFCHVSSPILSVSTFHVLLQLWSHLTIGPESAEPKYLQWNLWHSDPKLTIPPLHCSYGILVTVIRKQTNTLIYW